MAQLEADIDSAKVTISLEIEAEINEIHQLHCNPCP